MIFQIRALCCCCLLAVVALAVVGCAEISAFSPFVQGVNATSLSPLAPPAADPEIPQAADPSADPAQPQITPSAAVEDEEIIPAETLLKDLGAAPELKALTWVNAEPVTLRDLRGQVVMIEFWSYG